MQTLPTPSPSLKTQMGVFCGQRLRASFASQYVTGSTLEGYSLADLRREASRAPEAGEGEGIWGEGG